MSVRGVCLSVCLTYVCAFIYVEPASKRRLNGVRLACQWMALKRGRVRESSDKSPLKDSMDRRPGSSLRRRLPRSLNGRRQKVLAVFIYGRYKIAIEPAEEDCTRS